MPLNITPIATANAGNPGINLTAGRPAAEARDNAIAVAQGQEKPAPGADPQVARVQADSRKIRMRTRTPSAERAEAVQAASEAPAAEIPATPPTSPLAASVDPAATVTTESIPAAPRTLPDPQEQAKQPAEDTRPLSPQFAALARQRRALQVKERELADRERTLATKQSTPDSNSIPVSALKASPLRVLQENGVSYDQLTEALLAEQNGVTPEISKLKEEIKALKEGFEKNLTDRDSQAEQAALGEIRREAIKLAMQGDAFELVKQENGVPKVVDLIHRTYKKTGEVLDVQEAMQLVEDELLNDALERAQYKKVQAKLRPAAPAPAAVQSPEQQQPKPIRTLTSRDSVAAPMSRRDRAIAAMTGLKK